MDYCRFFQRMEGEVARPGSGRDLGPGPAVPYGAVVTSARLYLLQDHRERPTW